MPVSVKKKDGGRIAGPANVPAVIEIRCQVQLPNNKASFWTVHGFYTVVPPSMSVLANSLFTGISTAWSTSLASFMPPQTLFQNVLIRDMTSFLNPIFIGTGTAVPGTSPGTNAIMPVEVAAVITESIATRGKGMKGRIFLGGWATNADGGNGVIATALMTGLTSFGSSLFSAISGQSLTPCVAQVARQQYAGITGTVHPARTANHVNVTTYAPRDNLWDSQRRRGQL